ATGPRRAGLVRQPPTGRLCRLRDLAGLQAAGADVDSPGSAAVVDPDLLEVGVEAALAGNHRVAAAVPERRSLSARVTYLCHRRGSVAARRPGASRRPQGRSQSDAEASASYWPEAAVTISTTRAGALAGEPASNGGW